eukprot:7577925-Pyramimonas_sp.AAC.1
MRRPIVLAVSISTVLLSAASFSDTQASRSQSRITYCFLSMEISIAMTTSRTISCVWPQVRLQLRFLASAARWPMATISGMTTAGKKTPGLTMSGNLIHGMATRGLVAASMAISIMTTAGKMIHGMTTLWDYEDHQGTADAQPEGAAPAPAS